MSHAVRCPGCRSLSRVGADAVGLTVACPGCGRPFTARPDVPVPPPRPRPAHDPVPVVHPVRPAAHPSGHDEPPSHLPSPAMIGLALLPLGIPLLWLAGPLLLPVSPVFTFAAPVALAVAVGGLTLGVGFAHGWSPAAKVWAALLLVGAGYGTGGFLFFLKKEWAEGVRKHIGPPPGEWKPFRPPGQPYEVQLPGPGRPAVGDPLPGWGLTTYRCAPGPDGGRDAWEVGYEVAHGDPPAAVAGPDEAAWFAAARAAVERAADAEVSAEVVKRYRQHPGREYHLRLPDNGTNRIVRVYRVNGTTAVYLCVEGAFVPPDADYVRKFFDSFAVTK